MRVLLALPTLHIGGTERQVLRLAAELRSRRHDVIVLALAAEGPLCDEAAKEGVSIWSLGFPGPGARGLRRVHGMVRAALRTIALPWRMRRHRLDVVQAFLLPASVVALPAAMVAGVPVRIGSRRNIGLGAEAGWLPVTMQALADKAAQLVVANSAAAARSSSGRPVVVLPNGVDVPRWKADPTREPPVGVMVANLISYKGHLDLVAAMSLIESPPIVELYGEGPARAEVAAAIEAAGLANRLLLKGRHPLGALAYRDAQFALLTSHEEGLPNAVLEAMAAGLPVIATRVGGVPELVVDGKTGLLVAPRDHHALATAIARLVADGALRRSMGTLGREIAGQRFGWQRCVEAYEALYSSQP